MEITHDELMVLHNPLVNNKALLKNLKEDTNQLEKSRWGWKDRYEQNRQASIWTWKIENIME